MKIRDLKNELAFDLKRSAIKNYILEAEMLIENAFKKNGHNNVDRVFVLVHENEVVPKKIYKEAKKMLKKRVSRMPMAYILGYKYFYGLKFLVNKYTLIPRPETEVLVDEVLDFINKKKQVDYLVEVGTGSGCVAVSLAKNLNKKIGIIACDKSSRALKVAKKNVNLNKAQGIGFVKANLLNFVIKNQNRLGSYILVANLPYLPLFLKENLEAEIYYEPKSALFAGVDGLSLIKGLLEQISVLKNKPEKIFLEIHSEQKGALEFYIRQKLDIIRVYFVNDLSGKNRVCVIDL